MAKLTNAAPVIIKRKRVIVASSHHGGAWKVAYADFVTAMMAFFLLMWLLGATTEKQRRGVADYFSPTIPMNRVSGGGDGAFGGDSVFTTEELARNGAGAAMARPADGEQASGLAKAADGDTAAAALQQKINRALTAFGGESMTMLQALRHVNTRVTDEGLVIEIFDLERAPLFEDDTPQPTDVTRDIARVLAEVLALTTNEIAVNGHVRAVPVMRVANPGWTLSAARAQSMRGLLRDAGLDAGRVQRISGYADRKPVTADPAAIRNNRVEVILLRSDR